MRQALDGPASGAAEVVAGADAARVEADLAGDPAATVALEIRRRSAGVRPGSERSALVRGPTTCSRMREHGDHDARRCRIRPGRGPRTSTLGA